MATRRRFTTRYDSYGSVAYAPVYEGNTVRAPRREEEYQPIPQPRRRYLYKKMVHLLYQKHKIIAT